MNHLGEVIVALSLAALLILGGYQVYFLPQKYPWKAPRALLTTIDKRIPFWPKWVWVYSLLYYPFLLSIILTLKDFRHYALTAFSFFILLICQVLMAYTFPVKTPTHWRSYNPENSISERFLALVHSFDAGGNCFPSMHVGVAVLASLHLVSNIGSENLYLCAVTALSAVLILLSTLFTKQHYIADLPAGAALGSVVFWLFTLTH